MGIAQINLLVDTIFCKRQDMPEGSLVSLYVADRVTELVLGGYAICRSHRHSADDGAPSFPRATMRPEKKRSVLPCASFPLLRSRRQLAW